MMISPFPDKLTRFDMEEALRDTKHKSKHQKMLERHKSRKKRKKKKK